MNKIACIGFAAVAAGFGVSAREIAFDAPTGGCEKEYAGEGF